MDKRVQRQPYRRGDGSRALRAEWELGREGQEVGEENVSAEEMDKSLKSQKA